MFSNWYWVVGGQARFSTGISYDYALNEVNETDVYEPRPEWSKLEMLVQYKDLTPELMMRFLQAGGKGLNQHGQLAIWAKRYRATSRPLPNSRTPPSAQSRDTPRTDSRRESLIIFEESRKHIEYMAELAMYRQGTQHEDVEALQGADYTSYDDVFPQISEDTTPQVITPYQDSSEEGQPTTPSPDLQNRETTRTPLGDITETMQSDHRTIQTAENTRSNTSEAFVDSNDAREPEQSSEARIRNIILNVTMRDIRAFVSGSGTINGVTMQQAAATDRELVITLYRLSSHYEEVRPVGSAAREQAEGRWTVGEAVQRITDGRCTGRMSSEEVRTCVAVFHAYEDEVGIMD